MSEEIEPEEIEILHRFRAITYLVKLNTVLTVEELANLWKWDQERVESYFDAITQLSDYIERTPEGLKLK